ncbi:MAG: Xaa-Pro dipeptidase [Planctomycetota bacterium]
MKTTQLYAAHLDELNQRTGAALCATRFDGLVIHSGTPLRYFADDQDATFRPTPHFARWLPLHGPAHLILIRPGERPFLVRLAPEDYWYEQVPLGQPFWAASFEMREVGDEPKTFAELPRCGRLAFLGDCPGVARDRGFAPEAINPAELIARLDWHRSYKTDYEVACIEEATRQAGRAHRTARDAFEEGESELDIHHAYLEALHATEEDLPYPTIIAEDEKAAILHYTGKRRTRDASVLLIDSGARHLGYACDIRYVGARFLFRDLLQRFDQLQRSLCAAVRPGLPYLELHEMAHVQIGDLLHDVGVLRIGGRAALERGLTAAFFPHGLGHFLGLQVHDVAGHQSAEDGGRTPPPGNASVSAHHAHHRGAHGVHHRARPVLHRDALGGPTARARTAIPFGFGADRSVEALQRHPHRGQCRGDAARVTATGPRRAAG